MAAHGAFTRLKTALGSPARRSPASDRRQRLRHCAHPHRAGDGGVDPAAFRRNVGIGLYFVLNAIAMARAMHGAAKGPHLGLAELTIVSAWTFIHPTSALHYTHEYFDETKTRPGEKPALRRGLAIPGAEEPDYRGFLYLSFIIGVASQTADVAITSKTMRRTSRAHAILSCSSTRPSRR